MRPFFSFYGSKWRSVPRYPAPQYLRLIEPFAGSACYATRYPFLDVVLVEKDPIIAALWRYLIGASEADIMSIPLMEPGQTLDELDCEPAAKFLVGFWLNKATTAPARTQSKWMRSGRFPGCFWGEQIRFRVASQINAIKHWTIIEGDYRESPHQDATYFIDPPYQKAGVHYRQSAKELNFTALGGWCKSRRGQVIVCEQVGADWLPFQPLAAVKSMSGKSHEAVWISEGVSK